MTEFEMIEKKRKAECETNIQLKCNDMNEEMKDKNWIYFQQCVEGEILYIDLTISGVIVLYIHRGESKTRNTKIHQREMVI